MDMDTGIGMTADAPPLKRFRVRGDVGGLDAPDADTASPAQGTTIWYPKGVSGGAYPKASVAPQFRAALIHEAWHWILRSILFRDP